jgi:hypothetical protein
MALTIGSALSGWTPSGTCNSDPRAPEHVVHGAEAVRGLLCSADSARRSR